MKRLNMLSATAGLSLLLTGCVPTGIADVDAAIADAISEALRSVCDPSPTDGPSAPTTDPDPAGSPGSPADPQPPIGPAPAEPIDPEPVEPAVPGTDDDLTPRDFVPDDLTPDDFAPDVVHFGLGD